MPGGYAHKRRKRRVRQNIRYRNCYQAKKTAVGGLIDGGRTSVTGVY